MRKLLLLSFVLIAQVSFAQKKAAVMPELPVTNGHVVYEKSYNASGLSEAQLFSNAEHWFEKRYKSTEEIESRDRATGKVTGTGIEVLTFKGPLNRDVACKMKMKIEISSKGGAYSIRISDIIYGYQAAVDEERSFFSVEDLMSYASGQKVKNAEGINPVTFTKKQSVKALASLNPLIDNVMGSISETMGGK